MPKHKMSPRLAKVHDALLRAGRPKHVAVRVAAQIAKKACGKKR